MYRVYQGCIGRKSALRYDDFENRMKSPKAPAPSPPRGGKVRASPPPVDIAESEFTIINIMLHLPCFSAPFVARIAIMR